MKALLVAGLASFLAVGCVTGGDGEPEAPASVRTHYTLRTGPRAPFEKPLPARTDVFVDWHYSDGATTSVQGYRGWDFGGDERFEMIEVLGEDGQVQDYVYDFDGDGRPDVIREAHAEAKAEK